MIRGQFVNPVIYPLIHPMKDKIVIGLTGPAGSGKDTIANYMCSVHGFTKISFAGPLKSAISSLFTISPGIWEDRVLKEEVIEEWGKSPRELAQWLGTDILRKHIDDEIFIKTTRRAIRDLDKVVVSDVRFDNEARMIINDFEGEIWRLHAGQRLKHYNFMKSETKQHVTESGISNSLVNVFIDTGCDWTKTSAQVDNLV